MYTESYLYFILLMSTKIFFSFFQTPCIYRVKCLDVLGYLTEVNNNSATISNTARYSANSTRNFANALTICVLMVATVIPVRSDISSCDKPIIR